MRYSKTLSGMLPESWRLLALLAIMATYTSAYASADDDRLAFEQRLKRARTVLAARDQARAAAGWVPKSKDEQMLTKLGRLRDARIRNQELAMTRSVFEAARAEVYMQLARDYMKVGYYRRASGAVYTQVGVSRVGGPYYRTSSYWVFDPLAARLSAHFGEKAAQSKGIAAAQEYHANTYYERLIRNTGSRIAALQKKVKFGAQLAGRNP